MLLFLLQKTLDISCRGEQQRMQSHCLFQSRLQQQTPILMDGAMGTEILRRGVSTTLPLWSAEALLTHAETVQRIHEDYVRAGAEILITNTFRTTDWVFAKRDLAAKVRECTLLACQLAHQAIEQVKPAYTVYVAGSMAPLEDCYSPELTPTEENLMLQHDRYAHNLKDGGVDFLLLETMITVRETLAAVQAAVKYQVPFAVSFCVDAHGNLLGGETLAQAVAAVERYEPLFVGVNCVSPEVATTTVRMLRGIAREPISVYAQGDGMPSDEQGWEFVEDERIEQYVEHARQWIRDGAHLIGGCCGTSPTTIERLQQMLTTRSA